MAMLAGAGSLRGVSAQSGAIDWEKAAGGKMSFEVASVKRDTSGQSVRPNFPLSADDDYHPTGGLLSADFPVRVYITFAYRLTLAQNQLFLAAQLPKWADQDRFDIQARAAADTNPTKDQMRLMMQSLLADRFKLAVHWEKKEMPVYTLSVAPRGFKLKASDPKNDPAPGSVGCPADDRACAMMYVGSIPVADFAGDLGAMVGRPVIDKTGLTGTYYMNLKWAGDISPDSSLPSLPAALRDQFGLELKSEKASVDVLVIDHVEEPTPN
jgi:uncharacterized protein (TIGR03435 family)